MDPLSTLASIIALIQLVDGLVGGLKLVGSLHDAPSEAKVLVDELSDLQLVLHQIASLADQRSSVPKSLSDLFSTLIARTGKTLHSLDALLQKSVFNNGNGKSSRFAWLRHSDRINNLRAGLRDNKLSLSLLITSATLSGVWDMADRLDSLEKNVLPQMLMYQQAQAQLLSQVHNQQLIQASQRTSTVQGSPSTNTTSLSVTWNSSNVRNNQQLSYRMKRACPPACSCLCHKPVKISSSSMVAALLGMLHVKYRELPALAAMCNERSCQRQLMGSASLTYMFPPWLLHRMVSVTFSPRFGLHMVLRAPRIVADDAQILRYATVGDIEGIQRLMSDGLASPGDVGASYGMTALHIAFVKKDIDLCRFLIQQHADPSYETTLRRSVLDIVRDERINGKISENQVSQFASVFDEIDDYESFQLSPLHKSILGISSLSLESQLMATTVFIDSPDSLGRTALSAAAWRGDASAVGTLLQFGASPNVCTPTELSPLHRAIESRSFECVDLLLAYGAGVNHENKRGRTPLHYACRIPDGGKIARLLLEHGADVNAEDHGCSQALHECIVYHQAPQLELLLPRGIDVNGYTADGKTAVHLAVCNDNVAAFEALLAAGADFRKTTKNGSTILHMAACSASSSTIIALSELGGLSLNVQHVNLAGSSAFDVLDLNPNDSPELRAAFAQLAAKVAGDASCDALDMNCETGDTFQDAVSYQ
jgi:ankyrin repeat protein